MQLVLADELLQFGTAVRAFLAANASLRHVRATHERGTGFDRPVWRRMCDDLGVGGLLVPETHGGSGAGLVAASVVQQELGRGIVPSPLLSSSILAATVLTATGDAPTADDLLPGIASGERLVALAFAEDAYSWLPRRVTTIASRSAGTWRLTGSKAPVLDAGTASSFIVSAAAPDGTRLFLVDADGDGVQRVPLKGLDPGRSAGRVQLRDVRAHRITTDDVEAVLRRVDEVAAPALAAERLGALDRILELTTSHVRDRFQFGRPIGSFQAVKHPLADLAMQAELACSAVRHAAWCGDHSPAELGVAAMTAGVVLDEFHFPGAATMIQLHGGVGYTWEHDAHLFYRHAKTAQLLFGTPSRQRRELARRLDIGGHAGTHPQQRGTARSVRAVPRAADRP